VEDLLKRLHNKSKLGSIIKDFYLSNKLPLKYLFGILFVFLISTYTLFDNTNEIEALLEDFRESKINEIGVTFDSEYKKINVKNNAVITNLTNEFYKFEWEVMKEKNFIDYDGHVYTLDIEGDTHIDEIKLIGKQYILMTVVNSDEGSYKEYSLKTDWDDHAYYRIIQLINSIEIDQP
jgi:hypothetical protein